MLSVLTTGALLLSGFAAAEPDPRYVCSFCLIGLGLVEQSAFQVHLERGLQAKCNGHKLCEKAVEHLVLSLEAKGKPEDICKEIGMCTQDCPLFSEWPVNPLPPKPPAWPIERKLVDKPDVLKSGASADGEINLHLLKPILSSLVQQLPEGYDMWSHVSVAMAGLMEFSDTKSTAFEATDGATQSELEAYPDSCDRHNITCKITALVDHKPLQDRDGDRFSVQQVRRMRGSDWRGYDCDDKRDDVYPGRRAIKDEDKQHQNLDHNCNGIYGGNVTGLYEDLFCANSQPRGLVILGDSATAHFHIPPQWLTADGWNMDQLLPDAMNELDQPHCSWGTGHATAEQCPYQYPVPGVDGVVSLYTQLRSRNRCNHNDFQNIGVNGARVTSSMQLVEAMSRDQQNDNPLLVWFALIGNDVCNGHPGFGSMTPPDEFYTKAMESLNALDKVVPASSHVVALALFDGELLYATMHNKIHPMGTTYQAAYDFMNCLEENPCWGWLNSNETARRETTVWSNQLNRVYQNISDSQNFQNFKFIFYSPAWVDIFNDYARAGYPLTNLIEPTDGFHPSQAGNAIFAQKFYEFLETEHPEALGPVNPYNAEIDALFFKQRK